MLEGTEGEPAVGVGGLGFVGEAEGFAVGEGVDDAEGEGVIRAWLEVGEGDAGGPVAGGVAGEKFCERPVGRVSGDGLSRFFVEDRQFDFPVVVERSDTAVFDSDGKGKELPSVRSGNVADGIWKS